MKNQVKKNINCINKEFSWDDIIHGLANTSIEDLFDQHDFQCNKEQNIIRVRAYNYEDPGYTNVVRNLISVSAKSKDIQINYLIDELNELYNKIINIKSEFLDEVE